MDDFVVNVRQIGNYPPVTATGGNDILLLQQNGLGGAYASITAKNLVSNAMLGGGNLNLTTNNAITWGAISLSSDGVGITANAPFTTTTLYASSVVLNNSDLAAGQNWVNQQLASLDSSLSYRIASTVTSFNRRTGDIYLSANDIYWALGVQGGDSIATTSYVSNAINSFYYNSALVHSFNGKTGDVTLTTDDVNQAWATSASSSPYIYPQAPNPSLGDASTRVATTMFVDESLDDLYDRIQSEISQSIDLSQYAPLASPQFSGIPTAPTAATGNSTGQLATTAFVHNAVVAATTGVASFNTRTGAVVLTAADITSATGALLASPAFTGTPTAPTASPATNTTQLATTAFVQAAITAITAGVTSFNTRSGAVTLTTADVTGAGGAPLNNPNLTGTPTAPTAAPATSNTQIATTAFVQQAVTSLGSGVVSWNGRTGAVNLQANDLSAVGGALLAGPTFTGVPSAPTAAPGTNTTQLATTGFVMAQLAAAGGVASFNTRTGAVTLTTADVTGAGGAPIASPGLTGTPTAPTAVTTDSSTAIATTAFVKAAISASVGVASFNTRTGAVTLTAADVSSAGGALLASPTFTGTPAAPTATAGTATTQIATTAFVAAAFNNTVASFNGRNGAVTLTAADITAAGGALLASPTFTGTPTAPTPTAGTANTQVATTAFVSTAVSSVATATYTTWNPGDLANSALSNNNLTATATGSGVASANRGTIGITSGKYYFEYTITGIGAGSFGVGLGLLSVGGGLGMPGGAYGINTAGTVGLTMTGQPWVNGAISGSNIGAVSVGNTIGIAVDMTAQLIWFRIAGGNWNNSGTANPATGAGGISISAVGSPLYPYQGWNGGSTGQVTTANFGATAFSGAVPSGFASGILNTLTGSVRYDAPQSLTGGQQTQARVNIGSVGSVQVHVFTANTTYTPAANMIFCMIECVGGGGSGGNTQNTSGGQTSTTSGGGGGGYARTWASKSSIGASKAVTVGAGGSASGPGANGGAGGTSSVGSLCVATGGAGGSGGIAAAATFNTGSQGGGSGSSGDFVCYGQSSTPSFGITSPNANGIPSNGGCSGNGFGGGGIGNLNNSGQAGVGYGGGGGGMIAGAGVSAMQGGFGSAGVVIITEFLAG